MNNLQDIMNAIDDVKEKLTSEEYEKICQQLKKENERVKSKFIKIMVIKCKLVCYNINEDSSEYYETDAISWTNDELQENDFVRMHTRVRQDVTYHTLQVYSNNEEGAPKGFYMDEVNNKIRIHSEEHLEALKKSKFIEHDNKIYIYIDEIL